MERASNSLLTKLPHGNPQLASMVLLTPGPCQTSEAVRQAGALQETNHRDPAFIRTLQTIKQQLLQVNPGTETWNCYLLGASGTGAVEAMLTSTIGDGQTLVVESGYYSERLSAILEAHRMPFQRARFGWLEPWDLAILEKRIKEGSFEAVVCTHHETTSGRLNPVSDLGAICRRYGVHLLVDAMSSFGADLLHTENVDALCSSSNKCLHSVPGVSFVLSKPELVKQIANFPARTFYLDIRRYEGDEPPMTPPVAAVLSLAKALELYPGVEQRQARYETFTSKIREAVRYHSLQTAVLDSEASCTLTCCELPRDWTSDAWLKVNAERGYMLYGCKGELKERYFQVANMGELADADVLGWIATLNDLLDL